MARVRGCGGDVKIGTITQTGMREWSLDYTVNILDGRGFDDNCEPHPIVGMIEWGGSFRGPKDGAPITPFAEVDLALQETATTTGTTQEWRGSAIITGIHPTASVDGLVEYSYDYTGKGALSLPSA